MDTQLLVSEKVVEGLDEFLTRPLEGFCWRDEPRSSAAELMGCKQDASSDQTWLAEIFADALLARITRLAQACHYFSEIRYTRDGPARFISSAASTWGRRRPRGHGMAAYAWKASDYPAQRGFAN